MTAAVIQMRDYEHHRVPDGKLHDEPAEVVILPVVRTERYIADMLRSRRRSLLGEPR